MDKAMARCDYDDELLRNLARLLSSNIPPDLSTGRVPFHSSAQAMAAETRAVAASRTHLSMEGRAAEMDRARNARVEDG
nr:hypothetical protein CFP56_28778 [Quercus suber]